MKKLAVLLSILITLFVAASVWVWQTDVRYATRIVPGVVVGDLPLGGMEPEGARSAVRRAFTPFPAPSVRLRAGDRVWTVHPEQMGVQVDADAIVERAMRIAHRGDWRQRLSDRLECRLHGCPVPLLYTFDDGTTDYFLAHVAQQIDRPLREPRLRVEANRVVIEPGSNGVVLDVEATRAKLYQAFRDGNAEPVEAVVRVQKPIPIDMEGTRESVQRLLAHDLLLVLDDAGETRTFTLTRQALAGMVVWKREYHSQSVRWLASIDESRLEAWVEGLKKAVFKEPKDARLDFDEASGQVVVLTSSVAGRKLNVESTVKRIMDALEARGERVSLAVDRIKPEVDEADIPEMGIREVVGQATTSFRGSRPGRVQNIKVSAERFRGVVIPPGGVFSFNEHIGPVDAEHGFVESLIIKGDRTAVGIGGGVCQVSTTLFQAAFWAGLPILERWAHGYIVRWYGDPGMDATVYTPNVDLKFTNNTGHYLLIKPVIDEKKGTLTFRLYGTSPGWQVRIAERKVEDMKPPPPAIYEENPKLPKGTIKQVEWPKPGEKVTIVREVVKDGKVISRDEFVSVYTPWPARFEYGPGTVIPTPTPLPSPTSAATAEATATLTPTP